MSSSYSPLYKRILYKIAPFLFKRCFAGNYHWRWDRICYCMVHERTGQLGGIYDFRNEQWLMFRNEYDAIAKESRNRHDIMVKVGHLLGIRYPSENRECIIPRLIEILRKEVK